MSHLIDILALDYRVKDKEGNTPFFTAIIHEHMHLVRYFVEELKCSVNETKDEGIGALHLAASHNNT